MSPITILTAALLPPVLLGMYIWRKDPKKEPASQLMRAAVWGIAISIPVASIEYIIQTWLFGSVGGSPTTLWGTTVQAFCVAALPEEAAKLFALWIILRKNPYFDEHFDGIVYAVFVSLGFAAVENVAYVLGNADWMSVAISRALLSVPGHYAFAVLMGYYYSVYHFIDHSKHYAVCVLLVPVLAHGVYDAIALGSAVDPLIGSVAFVVLVYFCIKMHKQARIRIESLIERDKKTGK